MSHCLHKPIDVLFCIMHPLKPDAKEEIAATKIQAGIRGYLGRQKVKAIRRVYLDTLFSLIFTFLVS